MRRASLALLICTMICAPFIFPPSGEAQDVDRRDGFYVHVDPGVSFVQDTTVISPFIQGGKMKLDPGGTLGVAFGYRLPNGLAAEIETGIVVNFGDRLPGQFGDTGFYQIPILVNLIYEVPTHSRFRPFAGVGIGGVDSVLEDTDLLRGHSQDDFGFAWQGVVGCRYQLSSSIDLGLSYKYLGTTDRSFDAFSLQMKGTQTHAVTISIAVRF